MSKKNEINEIYEKAKEQFDSKKESIEVDEKESFLKNNKKVNKNLQLLVLGGIVLGGAYMFAQKSNSNADSQIIEKDKGLVNIIGEAPTIKHNDFVEKPDMPLEEEEEKEKSKLTVDSLPPLPKDESNQWYERKLTAKKASEYSSTNEKAINQKTRNINQKKPSDDPVLSSEFQSLVDSSSLGDKLKPTVTDSVKAQVLPNRDYLMTKGTSIDCTLINAIDTSVEGFVTCRTAHDVYSESGRVLLVERGSKVVGEYKTLGRNQGEPRLFILWSRLTTPHGISVDLNSAGTDSLGRAGVEGDVNQFWFKRFGSAFLTSIMQDGLQILNSEINRNRGSDGVIVSTDNTMKQSERLIEELLAQNRGIMPRLVKNQGEIVRIFVSRDINFDEVYQLKGINK